MREETFARQKELGVIPADAVLTERSAGIPAWDEMSEPIKPVLAREMEVYAGFLAYADHHVGRLIDAIEELGVLDDTLIYVIIGDNGASAEGNFVGTTNEGFTINHMNELETEEYMVEHKDDLGTPALVQPLRHRLGARHGHALPVDEAGGLALGRHPQRHHRAAGRNGIQAKGEIRNQFAHCIDVAPTILEAAGIPEPTTVHGVTQRPMEGVSMRYSLRRRRRRRSGTRPSTSRWSATGPSTTWAGRRSPSTRTRGSAPTTASTTTCGSSTTSRRTGPSRTTSPPSTPSKLAELQRLFLIQAARFNVLPARHPLGRAVQPRPRRPARSCSPAPPRSSTPA